MVHSRQGIRNSTGNLIFQFNVVVALKPGITTALTVCRHLLQLTFELEDERLSSIGLRSDVLNMKHHLTQTSFQSRLSSNEVITSHCLVISIPDIC